MLLAARGATAREAHAIQARVSRGIALAPPNPIALAGGKKTRSLQQGLQGIENYISGPFQIIILSLKKMHILMNNFPKNVGKLSAFFREQMKSRRTDLRGSVKILEN